MKVQIKIKRIVFGCYHFIFRETNNGERYDGFYWAERGGISELQTFCSGASETSKHIIERIYKK